MRCPAPEIRFWCLKLAVIPEFLPPVKPVRPACVGLFVFFTRDFLTKSQNLTRFEAPGLAGVMQGVAFVQHGFEKPSIRGVDSECAVEPGEG